MASAVCSLGDEAFPKTQAASENDMLVTIRFIRDS
jgi:hypothetical protein